MSHLEEGAGLMVINELALQSEASERGIEAATQRWHRGLAERLEAARYRSPSRLKPTALVPAVAVAPPASLLRAGLGTGSTACSQSTAASSRSADKISP